MNITPQEKTNPHHAISSYFIGPKSENMGDFRANITAILDKIVETRSQYQEKDDVCPKVQTMEFETVY